MLAEIICFVGVSYYLVNSKSNIKSTFSNIFLKYDLDYKVIKITNTSKGKKVLICLGITGFNKLLNMKDVIQCAFNKDVCFVHNNDKRFVTIYLLDIILQDYSPLPLQGNQLYISNNYLGEKLIIDMNKSPHVLCSGNVGTGKTEEIKIILTNLIYNKDVEIYMADLSQVNDYGIMSKHFKEYTRSLETSEQLFKKILNEYEYRLKLFSMYNVKNIGEYNRLLKRKINFLYLVLDEFADFYTSSKKDLLKQNCNFLLRELIRKCRKTGIFLIVGMQQTNSNILDTNIKGCFCTKICFAQNSNANSINVCDTGELLNLQHRKALLLSNSQREFFNSSTINNKIIENTIK